MINVTELRNGAAFQENSEPYQVIEYQHTKLGRGTANIWVKIRHLKTGKVATRTFVSGARVEPLSTDTRELQFLYKDDSEAYFMDQRSFEQFTLSLAILGQKANFLKEGAIVKMLFVQDEPLTMELPMSMVFKVVQAPPGVRGNSANASFKQVKLDNGLVVRVPLFVEEGDRVKIDTRTLAYLARSK